MRREITNLDWFINDIEAKYRLPKFTLEVRDSRMTAEEMGDRLTGYLRRKREDGESIDR